MIDNNSATLVICLQDHEVMTAAKILHNRKNLLDEYYLLINNSFYQKNKLLLEELNFTTLVFNHSEYLQENLNDSVTNLNKFLQKLNSLNFQSVVNLSYTKLACYLTSSLEVMAKRGPRYDLRGNISIRDQWSQYLYSSYDCGAPNPFSLEYLFQRIINIQLSDKENTSTAIKNHICITLSRDYSVFKTNEISSFIYTHLKKYKNHEIVLIPTPDNAEILNAVINQDHLEFFNKKIVIAEPAKSAQLLKTCLIHISDDDYFSSISSVYLRPSIQAFSNYSELVTNSRIQLNSIYIAQSSNSIITHNLINECADAILKKIDVSKELSNLSALIAGKNNVYSSVHKNGNYLLQHITGSTTTLDEVVNSMQFYIYNLAIDDIELAPVKLFDVTHLITTLSNMQQGLQFIFELGEHYQNSAQSIFKESNSDRPNIATIQKFSQRVIEIESLLEQIGQKFPELLGFIHFNLTYQRNIEDESLQKMAEKHILAAHQLKTLTSAFYELIESTLSRYNKRKDHAPTV
jgi:hypothetical protein